MDLGAHHRRQRKLLNPVFNVNCMRLLIPIFYGVTRQVLSDLCMYQPAISIIIPAP